MLTTMTPSIPEHKVEAKWFVIDATGQTLGRLASTVAYRLRGKHKPTFTPHVNGGDHVIVINAKQIRVSGQKAEQKIYYRHTGFPGGLKEPNFNEMIGRAPEKVIERAVKGMLPKGTLGRDIYRKLKVYADANHPHSAQCPANLSVGTAGGVVAKNS